MEAVLLGDLEGRGQEPGLGQNATVLKRDSEGKRKDWFREETGLLKLAQSLRTYEIWDKWHLHLLEPSRSPFFWGFHSSCTIIEDLLCARWFPGVRNRMINDKESTYVDEMLWRSKHSNMGCYCSNLSTRGAGTTSALQTGTLVSSELQTVPLPCPRFPQRESMAWGKFPGNQLMHDL